MTKADLFLRMFEAYPGTLKRFETFYASFSVKTVARHKQSFGGKIISFACISDPESKKIYTQTIISAHFRLGATD